MYSIKPRDQICEEVTYNFIPIATVIRITHGMKGTNFATNTVTMAVFLFNGKNNIFIITYSASLPIIRYKH